jgi:SAM-dependent methyltransferase
MVAQVWNARYELGWTPWDLGGPHPELVQKLADDPALGAAQPGTALVPGCGTGHDAEALARSGWIVTAVDFAPALIGPVEHRLVPLGGAFVLADALDFEGGPFDLVFDHTFFCAIEPEMRSRFGDMVDRVAGATGRLVSVVFPHDRPSEQGGPPWGMVPEDVTNALGPGWKLTTESEERRIRGRAWPYRWAEWTRSR